MKNFFYIKKYSNNRPVVLGSSELGNKMAYDGDLFHINQFFQTFKTPMTPLLVGGPYSQNLNTFTLLASGAITNESPILIYLSPIHFSKNLSGQSHDHFLQNVSDIFFYRAYLNSPVEFKNYLRNRYNELQIFKGGDFLIAGAIQEGVLHNLFTPLAKFKLYIENMKETTLWLINEFNSTNPSLQVEPSKKMTLLPPPISEFPELQKKALILAAQKTKSNHYGIYDEYFLSGEVDNENRGFKSEAKKNFLKLDGKEWEDYEALCKLIKVKNFNVYFVIGPVNERFYSTMGLKFDNRNDFYNKIQNIADQNNIPILSLGEHSSEMFWLKDPIHNGWLTSLEVLKVIYVHFKIR